MDATDKCEGWGHLSMGTMGDMTTFGLRTECMLSYGSKLGTDSLNPLLQDLRGKSGLIS
jgi:hypothetical protein